MEAVVTPKLWQGRRVLITGHTGFKGTWLAAWLQRLGADVSGYALAPPTKPALFEALDMARDIRSELADLRDLYQLADFMADVRPEVVFHLAAQPLVLEGYADPVGTYSTNVMGTVHVLECARHLPELQAVVIVTSDKCYHNEEWEWAYRETDRLGGNDPYSSSKACAELVTETLRKSFFAKEGESRVASVRAGNIIGGGDWGAWRLVPDLVRSAISGESVTLRHPEAVRPWQHVLDPLHGYIIAAEKLLDPASRGRFDICWNFGPLPTDLANVGQVVADFARIWGTDFAIEQPATPPAPEATTLRLDSSKARLRLGWRPLLDYATALEWTVKWYRAYHCDEDLARTLTHAQIDQFMQTALQSPAVQPEPDGDRFAL